MRKYGKGKIVLEEVNKKGTEKKDADKKIVGKSGE